jgi:endoglucanase
MLAVSLAPPEDLPLAGPRAIPPATPGGLSPVTRRALLAISTAALVATPACVSGTRQTTLAAPDDPQAQYAAFRKRFINADGRVVDSGNQGVSHSEGQGYAMLFAETFDDRETFERVFGWTRQNLRRPDGLYAWRWRPGIRTPVEDPNNATDGDIYIAYALLRGAERWGQPEWRREAQGIGQAILTKLVVEVGGRTLLLPGAFGFDHPDRVVVNPSYYAFPALFALSRAVPDRAWNRLMADGAQLLRQARFGRWSLPADWVEIQRGQGVVASAGPLRPAQGWPPRFGYDAARVPLHLAWAGMSDEPAVRAPASFWNQPGLEVRPAWTDLRTGQVAPFVAPPGIQAIAEVTTAAGWQRPIAGTLPGITETTDYYSSALSLLARIALAENPRTLTASATQPVRA